jgi:acyl-coenzyme A synthetase/AMP-(fatty) acid ligase
LLEGTQVTSLGTFLARIQPLAESLRGIDHVINLCERRPAFLAAFAATRLSGAITILPASRSAQAIANACAQYPGARILDDEVVASGLAAAITGDTGELAPRRVTSPSARATAALLERWHASTPAACAAIAWTSGSSGEPTAHRRSWAEFTASIMQTRSVFIDTLPAALQGETPWIVGTVPAHHMFGLELSVLLPLLGGLGLHAARPLLPAEVATALEAIPHPRILVSAPAHLQAIVRSGLAMPHVDLVASATAPMSEDLARAVETITGARLLDMLGSTETCLIGCRRPTLDLTWRAYPGVRFERRDSGTDVLTPWFEHPRQLPDKIDADDQGRFVLHGRHSDFIDVAGKRASLADLNRQLLAIPGVVDGVIFQPSQGDGLVRRLAALVVAPGLSAETVRDALARGIDPVFLPRPLHLVERLPRNDTGKLPRERLEDALAAIRRTSGTSQ